MNHSPFNYRSGLENSVFSLDFFSESVIEECTFDSPLGLCPKWKNGDGKTGEKWRFSSQTNRTGERGINFIFVVYTVEMVNALNLETLEVYCVSVSIFFWSRRLNLLIVVKMKR